MLGLISVNTPFLQRMSILRSMRCYSMLTRHYICWCKKITKQPSNAMKKRFNAVHRSVVMLHSWRLRLVNLSTSNIEVSWFILEPYWNTRKDQSIDRFRHSFLGKEIPKMTIVKASRKRITQIRYIIYLVTPNASKMKLQKQTRCTRNVNSSILSFTSTISVSCILSYASIKWHSLLSQKRWNS